MTLQQLIKHTNTTDLAIDPKVETVETRTKTVSFTEIQVTQDIVGYTQCNNTLRKWNTK